MKIPAVLLFLGGICMLWAQTVHFAPLPVLGSQAQSKIYLPVVQHLQRQSKQPITMQEFQNYEQLIESFIAGKTDLAVMGPLPARELLDRYDHVKALGKYKGTGQGRYRCVLSAFMLEDTPIDRARIALTQPLSTCGYYGVKILLQRYYDMDIQNLSYAYTGSHAEAIQQTIAGKFDIAGARESVAKRYESIGAFVLAKSRYYPSFVMLANTATMKPAQIQTLQKALLSLPGSILKTLPKPLRQGFMPASLDEYTSLEDFAIPQKGNM